MSSRNFVTYAEAIAPKAAFTSSGSSSTVTRTMKCYTKRFDAHRPANLIVIRLRRRPGRFTVLSRAERFAQKTVNPPSLGLNQLRVSHLGIIPTNLRDSIRQRRSSARRLEPGPCS